jgi:phosphate:Na+ symporter
LDRAALVNPVVAVEAARRTVALAIEGLCESMTSSLQRSSTSGPSVAAAADALEKTRIFLSEVSGPPASEEEELRLISTLRALDHATRLADLALEDSNSTATKAGPEDVRVVRLSEEALRAAAAAVNDIAKEMALSDAAEPIKSLAPRSATPALAKAEQCANALRDLRRTHRTATLSAVAGGHLSADEAMVRVDLVRRLDALAHHAWRAAAHLLGRGDEQGLRSATNRLEKAPGARPRRTDGQ